MGRACVPQRSQDNFQESVLFYHVGFEDQIQDLRLESKHLYSLSNFSSPPLKSFFVLYWSKTSTRGEFPFPSWEAIRKINTSIHKNMCIISGDHRPERTPTANYEKQVCIKCQNPYKPSVSYLTRPKTGHGFNSGFASCHIRETNLSLLASVSSSVNPSKHRV